MDIYVKGCFCQTGCDVYVYQSGSLSFYNAHNTCIYNVMSFYNAERAILYCNGNVSPKENSLFQL